jgi:hypothetical protein
MACFLTNSRVTTDIVDQSYGSDLDVTPKYASTCLFHEPLIIKPKFVLPLLWGSNQTPRPRLDPPRNDSPELVGAGAELNFNDPPSAYWSASGKPGGLQISSPSPENGHENALIESGGAPPCKCREK